MPSTPTPLLRSEPVALRHHTRSQPDYDAIVVGARVAGAATALQLARSGHRVLLVDRRRPDSDTLSTHALMRGAVVQLQRWGLLDRLVAAGTPAVVQTLVHYGDTVQTIAIESKYGVDALYAPRRTVLDQMLVAAAEEAGAEVRFGVSVEDVVRDGTGRVLGIVGRENGRELRASARVTIGADGVRSRVARCVEAPTEWRGRNCTAVIYGYWPGTGSSYEWIFRPGVSAGFIPTNNEQVCVWVGVPQERFLTDLRRDLDASFYRLLREAAPEKLPRIAGVARSGRLRGFAGAPGFRRRCWGPGWALVGDASHFKDPLSAKGITDALRDAEMLAQAVTSTLGGWCSEEEALAAYGRIRDRLCAPQARVADEMASHAWTFADLRNLHIELSRGMNEEIDTLLGLEELRRVRVA